MNNGGAGGADVVRQGYMRDEDEDEDTFMEREQVDKGPPEYSDCECLIDSSLGVCICLIRKTLCESSI